MSTPDIPSLDAYRKRKGENDDPDLAPLPSVTYTFLFTDIAGSTHLWETQPEEMRVALAQHDRIVREAVLTNGGVVVKTTGDGFHAVFGSTTEGVAAALAAQRALRAAPWYGIAPLQVRMSLHTGSAEFRDGDYYGPELNRAARLLAVGHGGQVLLTGAASLLAQSTLPLGATLRDMGQHRLKDLTQPEHIYQLDAPDLPHDFPPLKTPDARPSNWPSFPTELIGREADVATVVGMVREGARLVSLIGPGGMGKTRLGVQIGQALRDSFADGGFYVALETITDPDLVLSAIAATVDIRETGQSELLIAVKMALRDKRLLLVLDNFEQVVEAAPTLAALLQAAPGLTLVVTSRTALQIYGERVYDVPPLPLPDSTKSTPPDELGRIPAVTLFIQRAQAVKPSFALTPDNAATISAICARLDGLPLALELAATRIRIFSPQALLDRLDKRLALLTAGARDKPGRHQTLRATIDWSYALLDAAEQQLFRRMAVFGGAATFEAIIAISGEGDDAVVVYLEQLVGKSLVREYESGAESRFTMLETLREYALERLSESGEEALLRQRHASYYLTAAIEIIKRTGIMRKIETAEMLFRDYDNMRAALQWNVEHGDYGLTLRACAAFWPVWYLRGMLREGLIWLEIVLDHPQTDDIESRILVLRGAGNLLAMMGEFERAVAYTREGESLARRTGNVALLLPFLVNLGSFLCFQGKAAEALPFLDEGIDLALKHNLLYPAAFGYVNMSSVMLDMGDPVRAQTYPPQVIALAQKLNDDELHSMGLAFQGIAAVSAGAFAEAEQALTRALDMTLRIHYRTLVGIVHTAFSYLYLMQGRIEEARGQFAEALQNLMETGDRYTLTATLDGCAAIALTYGNRESAAHLMSGAAALRTVLAVPVHYAFRHFYSRIYQAIQASFEPQEWQRLWQEGQAMSFEQVITLARRSVTEDVSRQPAFTAWLHDSPAPPAPIATPPEPLTAQETDCSDLPPGL